MFFRRRPRREPTFEERLSAVRAAGFDVTPQTDGRVMVNRGQSAAVIENVPGALPRIVRAGWLVRKEIALLVDRGFQKFWRLEDGRTLPALAAHLKELHSAEEDLREALGLESLYNTSLGTTNDLHLYDRVEGREKTV